MILLKSIRFSDRKVFRNFEIKFFHIIYGQIKPKHVQGIAKEITPLFSGQAKFEILHSLTKESKRDMASSCGKSVSFRLDVLETTASIEEGKE